MSGAAISGTQIDLTWDAATDTDSGVAQYQVYRDGTLISTTSNTTFSCLNLIPETQYCFTITASDYMNNVSELSAPVCLATPSVSTPPPADVVAPSVPNGLKDHLHEQHGFDVTAYEVGPWAGFSVKEVLEEMLSEASFALLVLTGEDIDSDGGLHARENVIHELGLFQARLGFSRTIALLEEGVEEFSNISGLSQVRFARGHIRESFGDVVATIHREFRSPLRATVRV